MKSKVIIMARCNVLAGQEYEGDSIAYCEGALYIYNKGECVCVIPNHSRKIVAAWIVKPKKKRWKLKFVKE